MTIWTDPEADDTTVDNASFESAIGSSWTVNQNKLYIDATWERDYSQNSRTGDYSMRATLMEVGENYRGSTWFYNINTYPTTVPGHAYRLTVYAQEWRGGGDWTLRVHVSSDGDLNEYTDYTPAQIAGAPSFTACTHDFTGDGEDNLTLTVYCIAADTNTVEKPVRVDDISLVNLSKTGAWTEVDAVTTTWTETAAATTEWTEV